LIDSDRGSVTRELSGSRPDGGAALTQLPDRHINEVLPASGDKGQSMISNKAGTSALTLAETALIFAPAPAGG
jgi:hypothetical protein